MKPFASGALKICCNLSETHFFYASIFFFFLLDFPVGSPLPRPFHCSRLLQTAQVGALYAAFVAMSVAVQVGLAFPRTLFPPGLLFLR